MSNIDIIRRQIDAFNRRDADRIAADWHPEGIWIPVTVEPVEATPYVGPAGRRKFLEDFVATWEEFRLDYGSFTEPRPGVVLALGEITVRHRDSSVPMTREHAMVCELRDGQIVSVRSYLDHASARADAGAPAHRRAPRA